MKNRPRKPRGVSMSTVREVERIVRQGDRSFYRQFNSARRRALREGEAYGQ
jgi:hypothetical protein